MFIQVFAFFYAFTSYFIHVFIDRGFIKIFSGGTGGFHRQAKLFELSFFLRKMFL